MKRKRPYFSAGGTRRGDNREKAIVLIREHFGETGEFNVDFTASTYTVEPLAVGLFAAEDQDDAMHDENWEGIPYYILFDPQDARVFIWKTPDWQTVCKLAGERPMTKDITKHFGRPIVVRV